MFTFGELGRIKGHNRFSQAKWNRASILACQGWVHAGMRVFIHRTGWTWHRFSRFGSGFIVQDFGLRGLGSGFTHQFEFGFKSSHTSSGWVQGLHPSSGWVQGSLTTSGFTYQFRVHIPLQGSHTTSGFTYQFGFGGPVHIPVRSSTRDPYGPMDHHRSLGIGLL